MTLDDFKASVDHPQTPSGLSAALLGLWYAARDDWHSAHVIVQDDPGTEAAWVHAYLHRQEGDLGNADYWYHRAGRTRPGVSLDAEWEAIAAVLLDS